MSINRYITFFVAILLLAGYGCKDDDDGTPETNTISGPLPEIQQRSFKMGFSTWSYGPNLADVDSTYQFISSNSDIYTEQIDSKIPWDALINKKCFPQEFLQEVNGRIQRLLSDKKLILYVGLLNLDRDDLLEDFDGSIPSYDSLNEKKIEDAYVSYLDYLVARFRPDYLVASIEANELLLASEKKWQEYKKLMNNVRSKLKFFYPAVPFSESVTLHNWYKVDAPNPTAVQTEISEYFNQMDFVSVSFYPFFKGLKTAAEFDEALDFLHQEVSQPIAFIETCHLADSLEVPNLNLSIPASESEQEEYLSSLLRNAHQNDYEFIIWWAHRDYDRLWETFPDEVKDIGQLWRDTGILDENGVERPAYQLWTEILKR